MKFPVGTRVKVVKNNTEFDSWDIYVGTLGAVVMYHGDFIEQPYLVKLDFDGDEVCFDEDELEFCIKG